MTSPHDEAFLREILERALDAISARQREHIYRYDHNEKRQVVFHLASNLDKLNCCCPKYSITEESTYWDIIVECLEIALEDPVSASKPPLQPICSHKEAAGLEMHAFVVRLPDFIRPIYTKFCLKEQPDGNYYVSIDCHPSTINQYGTS